MRGTVMALGVKVSPELMGKRVLIDGWLRDWDAPEIKDDVGYYGSECDGGLAQDNVLITGASNRKNIAPKAWLSA